MFWSTQEDIERAYGEGAEAAASGDFWDGVMHTIGPLFSFGLETDEARAWDQGYSDEIGEWDFDI